MCSRRIVVNSYFYLCVTACVTKTRKQVQDKSRSNNSTNAHVNLAFSIEDEKNPNILATSHGDIKFNKSNSNEKLPIPSPNYIQKPIKTGRQRFRWNLMFNLLVWLIVPMPLWLPFVSQTVAIYLIPSVQAVLVLMWIIVVILASKNMLILYKYVPNSD